MTPTLQAATTGWRTLYRCGCSLITQTSDHPTHCPYHAKTGMARELLPWTTQLSRTAPCPEPVMWGLLVENLNPNPRPKKGTRP